MDNYFIEPRNWWDRDYAIEWWRRNGHFDEDLYLSVLIAKEQQKLQSCDENHQENEVKNQGNKGKN